jgi:hypothetical protein
MADLNIERVVDVQITRQTKTVTQAGFGTPGIIATFPDDYLGGTYGRFATYASLTEMTDAGWTATDAPYTAAQLVFSQNPKVSQVMIGRIDSTDADLATGLAAIENVTSDWYAFNYIHNSVGTLTFDTDFVTSNSIVVTVNGTAVTAVPFDTDNATTYSNLETQIETDIAGSSVTVDAVARTVVVVLETPGGVSTISAVVTGGASQPVGTATYSDRQVDYKAVAAWAETQKKIYMYSDDEADILNPAIDTDIASVIQGLNYDRTVSIYRGTSPDFFESAWMGETLPYDPGSQTWAYKTPAGVAVDNLSSGDANALDDKNCNYYVSIGGSDVTQTGKVASGEWIDIIRGIDWLEARMQEGVFTQLINNRKIPYTDAGITIVENAMREVLELAVQRDVLLSYEIEVPLRADIPTVDIANRTLQSISFSGILSGAIHTIIITGTVSY